MAAMCSQVAPGKVLKEASLTLDPGDCLVASALFEEHLSPARSYSLS